LSSSFCPGKYVNRKIESELEDEEKLKEERCSNNLNGWERLNILFPFAELR
jgi:hypothetical protein